MPSSVDIINMTLWIGVAGLCQVVSFHLCSRMLKYRARKQSQKAKPRDTAMLFIPAELVDGQARHGLSSLDDRGWDGHAQHPLQKHAQLVGAVADSLVEVERLGHVDSIFPLLEVEMALQNSKVSARNGDGHNLAMAQTRLA